MEISSWFLNYREHKNIACQSPCSMYSVLLEKGLMKDPFYGLNEHEATEMSRSGCEFYADFEVGGETLTRENILLVCQGLDTLCKLYLNGALLGETENMHRTYEFDLKGRLSQGANRLRLCFASPIEYVEVMHAKHKLWAGGTTQGIPHIRKALYMFGWDWGPNLPDMGIFRSVEISAWDGVKLENINVRQFHKNGCVTLGVELEGRGDLAGTESEIELVYKGQTVARQTFSGTCTTLLVDDPKLWWPNGYGEQNLYALTVKTQSGGHRAGEIEKTIGLRTLTVSTAPDKYGEEFCFVMNGHKIFSMGANFIPQDSILSRTNEQKTEKLIQDCIAANFNTLRVWGGGYYPEDYFYDLCDRYGLIVWQDFMFACINVDMTKRFEENVKAEFADNLRRLRHHASLGLLCGNNEMEWGVTSWKIGVNAHIKEDYIRLYERVMPSACEEYAPDVFYWSSSPSSGGGFDDPNGENRGDSHFWDVWHGKFSYSEYRNHYFRFCSEFGFESFPSMKTIRTFTDDERVNPFSDIMENHQKCDAGNSRILTHAAENYLYASDMPRLVYVSQLVQADAIRYGVEHMRRHRGRCMGSTYWQFNDCWPVASWSSVDCFGRWKALHYAAKRFYAPVLLTAHDEGFEVTLNISNETMSEFGGSVEYTVCDKYNKAIFSQRLDCSVGSLSSKDITTVCVKQYMFGFEKERYFKYTLFDAENNELSVQTLLFTKPKWFGFENPEIRAEIRAEGEIATIEISAAAFAKSVELDFDGTDIVLSDNYFDITSDKPIVLQGCTELPAADLQGRLRIKSVYDIG